MIFSVQLVLCIWFGLSPIPSFAVVGDVAAERPQDVGGVRWEAGGLTCAQLIERICEQADVAFAIRANEQGGSRPARLHCTADSVSIAQATQLVESVYGLTGWTTGRTSIWMEAVRVPGLIASDARQRGEALTGAEGKLAEGTPIGDVELEDASLLESVKAMALAFDVVIVYSSHCEISTDGVLVERLTLSLDDVDLDTCMSLMTERFKLAWAVTGDLIYLTSAENGAGNKFLPRSDADLRDGQESVTESEIGRANMLGKLAERRDLKRAVDDQIEAARLCRELENQ